MCAGICRSTYPTSISLFVDYLWKISPCISFSYDFVKKEIVVEKKKTAFPYGNVNTQDKQCTYTVTLRLFRITFAAVEKQ